MMTITIPVSQARQRFGELINQVYRRQVRIIVEKSGIPVAALVSLADLERWSRQDRDQEEHAPPTPSEKEVTPMAKESITRQPPTEEELARRQAVVAKILALREQTRSIAPLTTADLIHQVREERQKAYARWSC